MDNNFILLITALFTAGSVGFINCFILEKLGTLTFRKSNEQDKKHFLLLFSLLNYVIYLFIYVYISKFVSLEELLIVSISVILTVLFTTILSIFVFPFIATVFSNVLNFSRKKKHLSEIDHRSPRDIILNNEKLQSVFIFDFNQVLISSGYLEYYNNESDYYEIILVPFDEEPYLDNYNKVKSYSESKEGQEKHIKILLDFEKKLQYFIVNDID